MDRAEGKGSLDFRSDLLCSARGELASESLSYSSEAQYIPDRAKRETSGDCVDSYSREARYFFDFSRTLVSLPSFARCACFYTLELLCHPTS